MLQTPPQKCPIKRGSLVQKSPPIRFFELKTLVADPREAQIDPAHGVLYRATPKPVWTPFQAKEPAKVCPRFRSDIGMTQTAWGLTI